LAKIRAVFLHKAERLLHGAQITNNLENSDKWYESIQPAWGSITALWRMSARKVWSGWDSVTPV
jgi:hypothetical protein